MKDQWISATQIDQEIAEEDPCETCGGKCEYQPKFWTEDGEEHYQAFAVCTQCGARWEF